MYWWFSARLWYLHCVSNGVTTVLHWASDTSVKQRFYSYIFTEYMVVWFMLSLVICLSMFIDTEPAYVGEDVKKKRFISPWFLDFSYDIWYIEVFPASAIWFQYFSDDNDVNLLHPDTEWSRKKKVNAIHADALAPVTTWSSTAMLLTM